MQANKSRLKINQDFSAITLRTDPLVPYEVIKRKFCILNDITPDKKSGLGNLEIRSENLFRAGARVDTDVGLKGCMCRQSVAFR